MKKSLLVAALVAGFAGVAHAETSVTLYGIVDAGIAYERVDGTVAGVDVDAKRTGLLNGGQSGNRWGLKGTEDLGNGLQAVFVLENGFNLGNGTASQGGRMFGRQATIGLQSDAWGRLDFGRQTNITSKYFAWVASPFGTDFSQARAGTTFGAADSVRYDNMIMYQTPNYSGFQFGVGYSFNNSGNQNFKVSGEQPNNRAWTTGLRYANGPLAAALTYDQLKTAETLGTPDGDVSIKSWNLGASYDFEIVKVHAGFGQTRNGWLTALQYAGETLSTQNANGDNLGYIANDGMKINSYTVGLSAPVGANGKVLASWGMADPRSNGVYFNGVSLEKQHAYSLGYTYALSKRTNVYALGSYVDNVAFQDDLKATQVGVGIRHQF